MIPNSVTPRESNRMARTLMLRVRARRSASGAVAPLQRRGGPAVRNAEVGRTPNSRGAATTGAHVPCALPRRPGERAVEAVVAPEHLAVFREEGGGAEDPAGAGLLAQCLEARLVALRLGFLQDGRRVETETREDFPHDRRLGDAAALAELLGVDRSREGGRPAPVRPEQRDPRRAERVLRERVRTQTGQAQARGL